MGARGNFALATAACVVPVLLQWASPVNASGGVWVQQTVREQSDGCPPGWGQSWAQWPHGNTGGFVCNLYVDDPSANPDTWLYWAEILADGTSNNTNGHPGTGETPTPWCSPPGQPSTQVTPFGVRIEPPQSGVSVQIVGNMTVVTTTSTTDQIVSLFFACPAGHELNGVI